jgi:TonB family protein
MREQALAIDIPSPDPSAAVLPSLRSTLPLVGPEFQLAASAPSSLQQPEAAAPQDPALAAPDSLEPIWRVAPEYPAEARRRGLEGSVTLRYQIGADGRATEIQVDGVPQSTELEEAAREALQQWRYDPDAGPGQHLKVQFDFVLVKPDSENVHRSCERRTGSRLCRPSQDSTAALRTMQIRR